MALGDLLALVEGVIVRDDVCVNEPVGEVVMESVADSDGVIDTVGVKEGDVEPVAVADTVVVKEGEVEPDGVGVSVGDSLTVAERLGEPEADHVMLGVGDAEALPEADTDEDAVCVREAEAV